MNRDELLNILRQLEIDLYTPKFRAWVAKQTQPNKNKIRTLRTEIIKYRSGLETDQLKILADKLDELAPELNKGIAELQEVIKAVKDFIAVLNVLGNVIGLISKVVKLIA